MYTYSNDNGKLHLQKVVAGDIFPGGMYSGTVLHEENRIEDGFFFSSQEKVMANSLALAVDPLPPTTGNIMLLQKLLTDYSNRSHPLVTNYPTPETKSKSHYKKHPFIQKVKEIHASDL